MNTLAQPEPGGPFESEAEAQQLFAVRAVYEAFRRDPGQGKMQPHIHRLLCEALAAAGVQLGAYDHAIVQWLSQFEPAVAAVIASWASRARAAGGQALSTVWTRSPERRTWVAEGPDGQVLTVSKGFGSPRWVPAITGPGGHAQWTGTATRTREAAQRLCEQQARVAGGQP